MNFALASELKRIGMHPVRILVVDDHAIVRRIICSLLCGDPRLSVICQAASGEAALQSARELSPDVVLLDIGLPGMSGIEVGKHIRQFCPESQIIFLSQHESPQMVRAALEAGGQGYVAKTDAGGELLKAIAAVRAGKQFISQRIMSQGWREEQQTGPGHELDGKKSLQPQWTHRSG